MIYGNIKFLTEKLRMDYYYYELNLLLISKNIRISLNACKYGGFYAIYRIGKEVKKTYPDTATY